MPRSDPPLTVPELLAARAAREPERPAVLDAAGTTLTFGAWHARSLRLARALRARGLPPGGRVALPWGEDWTGYAVAFCAVLAAGGVAVPLSAALPDRQAAATLHRIGAAAVLHPAGHVPPAGPWWTADPDTLAAVDDTAELPPVRAGDLAQIVCTSGSTGTPKEVAATHGNLCHGHRTDPRPRRYAHSEAMLHAFPIGTNAAQMMLIEALTAHPALLCAGRFDADGFCALIERHRVGTVFLVPATAAELLRSGAADRYDLGGVHLVSSSAAALPPAVARGLAGAFPRAVLVNYYTSTEAVPAQVSMIVDPARPDSLGRPADPRDLRIADPDGRPLPPGETGEVWLRSDAPPRRYAGDPDASAAVFRDGWVRMGDLGRIDASGHLCLVDRESDVIKSGALKVSTLRIEAALLEHPAVAEAAAVGLPHAVMGAVPAAVIRADRPLDLDELRDFLAERLARPELPVRILPVDRLPRTETGKPVKPEIRRLLQAPADARPTPEPTPEPAPIDDPFARPFLGALGPTDASAPEPDPSHPRTEARPDVRQ
ncbi:long-chain fatty acid--CoA ligase [Kitasatospora paracochleata]|uniref:Acyl-CoA synthetase (AMP-forming)/AMP-acid ligase II n=1 Tax=Kitasatospora paracochleata TaxID=58354 RepID=A0ABT1J4G3_9ACTN|nr:class I adenylate-forming enzyme family protein [Kitasatospora paracochleata]MCP2312317.1 acyl-CoA synthetase (AMP-forming)/AMP-acid ligase II [Kitasatospora paracochleata]